MPALHLAEAANRGGARVWLYELCWGFGPQGASHGLDTLLVLGTADLEGEVTTAGPAAVAEAEGLSASIRAELLDFAATGDPGWTLLPNSGASWTACSSPTPASGRVSRETVAHALDSTAIRGLGRQHGG